MTGSYKTEGDQLSFSQMASTMMACVQGMELETEFNKTLGTVSHWRINGEELELLDSAGGTVAQFESRQMN